MQSKLHSSCRIFRFISEGCPALPTDVQQYLGVPLHCTVASRVKHWDGMDSGDTGMQWCRLGSSHSVPSFPWYIGMGWTVGLQACSSGNLPLLPFVNWNVSGTDQYVLTLPLRPNYGAMQWDTQVLLDVSRQCWTCVEDTYLSLSHTPTHTYMYIQLCFTHRARRTTTMSSPGRVSGLDPLRRMQMAVSPWSWPPPTR